MRLLSVWAGALLFTSCMLQEETPVGPLTPTPTPDGMAEIAFMAEMPTPTVVATRAVGTAPENKVDDVYVLVFETGTDGALVYKGKGRGLAVSTAADVQNNNRVTFKATLPVGTQYDFMVLANVGGALDAINVSDDPARKRSDVLALTRTLAANAKWNASTTPIPMWGELKGKTLAASDAVTFPLTRMLARVNVEYNPTNTAVPANFRLSSVRVYNYSKSGAVVPAETSLNTDGTAKLPTAPVGGYAAETGGALVYEGDAITANKSCTNMIYLFEAAHNGSTYKLPAGNADWIDNPCLVVGGKFSADGTNWPANDTYYRVDFIRKTGGATPTDEWMSVLRNFSYNVTITEVSGEGYRDPDEALRSAPFNMEANILPWNERDMGKVVFDGVFYLSVSRDEFVFQRRGEEHAVEGYNTLKIKTDYLFNSDRADAKSGWRVDRIVKAGTEEPLDGAWLFLNPDTRPSGWKPNDVNDAFFDIKENTSGADREADVWIKAGRLEYKVHVVQKILSLDVLDPQGNKIPDNTITHIIKDDGSALTGMYHGFMLEWSRGSLPVKVTGKNNANRAYLPEWVRMSGGSWGGVFPDPAPYGTIPGPGNEKTIPGQTTPVGNIMFDIKADGSTPASELLKDPFYDAYSTYHFEVTNNAGGVTETLRDSIRLRKVHYDILADQQKYRLDGGVHNLTVRSNANWEIISITEHLFNSEQPTPPNPDGSPIMIDFSYRYDNFKEGLHFGPNVNGTALSFHVVDNQSALHKGKWGSVKVKLKMTAPSAVHGQPGLTKEIDVTMIFPPATRLILGLGPGLDVRGYNIGIPTAYHLNSAFRMVNSPYNFGSMDESVYKVEGLRLLGYNCMGASTPDPNPNDPDFYWYHESLRKWLNDHSPDVLVISSIPGDSPHFTADHLSLLRKYLDNGGVIIMCSHAFSAAYEAETRTAAIMNAVFPGRSFTQDDAKYDSRLGQYMAFNTGAGSNDPIVSGPFSKSIGGLAGKHWGAHYYTTGVKTSKLPSTVRTVSTSVDEGSPESDDANFSSVFYDTNPNNRFMYIANGCAMASYYDNINEPYHDPFDIDDNLSPVPEYTFGPALTGNTTDTYNSYMIANAVAWALTVTNHMPPTNGY